METYKERYGRSPPRGFDAWWKFVRANDVLIVSSFFSFSPRRVLDLNFTFLSLFPGRRRLCYLFNSSIFPSFADHRSSFLSQYDQIHTSITPFLALDPVFLGSRLTQLLTKEGFSYELQVRRDEPVNIAGERVQSNRALEMSKLLYVLSSLPFLSRAQLSGSS